MLTRTLEKIYFVFENIIGIIRRKVVSTACRRGRYYEKRWRYAEGALLLQNARAVCWRGNITVIITKISLSLSGWDNRKDRRVTPPQFPAKQVVRKVRKVKMRGEDVASQRAMLEVPAFHVCRYRKTPTTSATDRRKRILILYFQVLSSRSSTPSILQTQLRSTSVPIVAGCPFKQINYRLKDIIKKKKKCTRTVAPLVTINPETVPNKRITVPPFDSVF